MQNRTFFLCLACLVTLVLCSASPNRALAILVASDDASNAAYDDGWTVGDNGGSGFGAWSSIGNSGGGGFGGGFIGAGNTDIGSGGSNEVFGVFGNNGGIGEAIRPFNTALAIGSTFSLDMDNQGIDTGNAVGFGLRNASGDNLTEFFFLGGSSNYTVSAVGASGTTPAFTTAGLTIAFTLTDADSFSLAIDELSNGVGVDHTVTGDLFAGGGDQNIANLRLFNGNGGPDVFFNNLALTAVPEPSAFVVGGLVCSVLGMNYARKRMSGKEAA